MAYSYNPKDEEDLENQGRSIGAEGGIVGGGSGPSGQTEGSGQYTNLQSYLDTNKNSNLGMGIAENVGKSITGAEQAQDKSGVDFRGAVDKGSVSKDMGNIESVIKNPWAAYKAGIGKPTDYGADKALGKGAFSDFNKGGQYKTGLPQERVTPPNFQTKSQSTEEGAAFPGLQKMMSTTAQSQSAPQSLPPVTTTNYFNPVSGFQPTDAVSRFKAQRDAEYQGPTDDTQESFFQPARRATAEASELGRIAGSESGNRALLKKYYQRDRGDYTEGQLNLDSLLARGDTDAKQKILNVQSEAAGLGSRFQNLQGQLGAYRDQRKLDTQDARNAARGAIGIGDQGGFLGTGPIQDILKATQGRSDAANKERERAVESVATGLKNKDISGLSDADRTKLGLGDVSSLYDIDPSIKEYLKITDAGKLTQSGVSTQDELNNINALSDLAALDQEWINPDKIGQASEGVWNYDTGKFKSDLDVRRQAYDKERRGLQYKPSEAYQPNVDIDDALGQYFFNYTGIPKNQDYQVGNWDNGSDGLTNFERMKGQLMDFETQGGARQLLKGSDKKTMDLSEDQRNDILRGFIDPGLAYSAGGGNAQAAELRKLYGSRFVNGIPHIDNIAQPRFGDDQTYKANSNAQRIEDEQSARGLGDYNELLAMLGDEGRGYLVPKDVQGIGDTPEDRIINEYKAGNFRQNRTLNKYGERV